MKVELNYNDTHGVKKEGYLGGILTSMGDKATLIMLKDVVMDEKGTFG